MNKDCVSLEVAKKLKEAGWRINGFFVWKIGKATGVENLRISYEAGDNIEHFDFFFAPTIGELLEALPNPRNITVANLKLYRCDDETWEAYFDDWSEGENVSWKNVIAKAPNAPDCLALLWLSLKEKNLIQ